MKAAITVILLLAAVQAVGEDYSYPIGDPYVATVVGTPEALRAELPEEVRFKVASLPRREGREMPEAFWYAHRLHYSYKLQSVPAPLIFVIGGTGGYHSGGNNRLLQKALYAAGFHVVGVTSPSHMEFIVSTSSTRVVGNMEKDAEDLYRVMQEIRRDIGHEDLITGFHLAGYSLGGTHAAFVARLDGERDAIGFRRVLLINPPVSVYNSMSKIDRMLQNVPGGMDNFHRLFEDLVNRLMAAYQESSRVEFTPEVIFEALSDDLPPGEQLAALIGMVFRLASANLIFSVDVGTDFGFIKPANVRLTPYTSLEDYLEVALRVHFTDYYHEFLWPFYEPEYPEESRFSFARRHSLYHLEDFLREAGHVGVIHNRDDVILSTGEIDFFPAVFGERATVYPNGGHMGNLRHRVVLDHVVEFFGGPR